MNNHPIVGFTGTQKGMTVAQLSKFKLVIRELDPWSFHHGDCIGADAQAHDIVQASFPNKVNIHIHPPTNKSKQAFKKGDDVWPIKPYLERNHEMVHACNILIATPGESVMKLRSGTWATIRYAQRHSKHIITIYPDGSVFEEGKE